MTLVLFKSFLNYSATYGGLFVLEWILPSDKPVYQVRHWWQQISLLFILRTIISAFFTAVFIAWNPFAIRPVWQSLPAPITIMIAFLLFTLAHYWSHRLRHDNEFIWRIGHQMHHSPKRFDLSLGLYVHPLDVVSLIVLLYLFTAALGLGWKHYAIIGILQNILSKAQHLNIKTPRWLGYIIFRPEQHRLHHATHDLNFGLISLWDIVFGTFKNTPDDVETIGFSEQAQSRFWDLLFFKKVS